MKITIWSDFICPFCFIGQSHLDKALETFEHAEEVEFEYKSFLLLPDAEYVPGQTYYQASAKMRGTSVDESKARFQQLTDMARNSGVDLNYDIAKFTTTSDAHRVFQYAKELGKGTEYFKRFYAAQLSEGELLSDKETIVRLAQEVGLDGAEVRKILDSSENTEKVTQDISEARSIGVQGVPFFVFNNKYTVSGAQPVQTFNQFLDKVWEEEQAVQ